MPDNKSDVGRSVTLLEYACGVCQRFVQMRVERPWWICPCCQARHIPADPPTQSFTLLDAPPRRAIDPPALLRRLSA